MMQEDNTKQLILGYWNTRAICEPLRLILNFVGETFTDKRYCVGPPPHYDKSLWEADNSNLGLLIPNLPYFIDKKKDIKLTQTSAIMRYFAEIYDLDGRTAVERAYLHTIMEGLRDWMYDFFDVTYCNYPNKKDHDQNAHKEGLYQCGPSSIFDTMKEAYLKTTLPKHLGIYSELLYRYKLQNNMSSTDASSLKDSAFVSVETIGDGVWILGSRITYVDFIMGEYLMQHELFQPGCLSHYPNLQVFLRQFRALPTLQEYFQSPSYAFEPLHNRYSHFHVGFQAEYELLKRSY